MGAVLVHADSHIGVDYSVLVTTIGSAEPSYKISTQGIVQRLFLCSMRNNT